ncbi:MAG: porin [Geobacter sp.]|nr:porin [Geobacter sp.]
MKKVGLVASLLVGLFAVNSSAHAETSVPDLQKQLDEINGKIQKLLAEKAADEQQVKAKSEPAANNGEYLKKLWGNTKISGYGELEYIFKKDNGNGKGGNTLDPHRVVLNVTSQLSDWIEFNSELEWEHGGSDGGADGSISVEQAYLTFKLNPALNVNAGVMLLPMGAINQNHEPTNFYSSARPALDMYLIPSTWQEMGVGISGALHKKVDYQLMAVSGLDGTNFDAAKGVREGRQGFKKDNNRNFAVAGRLDLRPVDGLRTSLSLYSGNSASSGTSTAYTTIAAVDGRYRISDFELAGEYVHVYQDRPESLNTEIGRNMSGYWVEGAWHALPSAWKQGRLSNADAVLFARYSELNTQHGGAADPSKTSGRFDRNYTTVGVSFLPIPSVAIKADYQFFGDRRAAGEVPLDNDKFQVTVGFVF